MPPVIPDRNSSLAKVEALELAHKSSIQDLQKKLSSIQPNMEDPAYLKLRIEEMSEYRQGLSIERKRVKIETDEVGDSKGFKAHASSILKREISYGDMLWDYQRKLRKVEEDSGVIAKITPDSQGSFVALLLKLYLDPIKRNAKFQSTLRKDAIEIYHATGTPADSTHPTFLRCSITGKFFDSTLLKAAHIVPHIIGPEMAAYLFGEEAGKRYQSAENILLMHYKVEEAFDNFKIAIIPAEIGASPTQWKTVVFDQTHRAEILPIPSEQYTLGRLHNKVMEFRGDYRPASRFLYFHFVMCLLITRKNGGPRSDQIWKEYTMQKAFPNPGQYMRTSMLRVLAERTCDDLSNDEFDRLVGGSGKETVPRGVSPLEEREIGRRLLEEIELRSEAHVEDDDEREDEDEDEDALLEGTVGS